MKSNKILRGFKLIKNHLLCIFLVLFIITITVFLIIDNLYVHFNLNGIIMENSPIIDLIIWISGIGGAVVLYSDYLVQKQHEAVFGFYANMRFYLKRLNVFLDDNFSKCDIIKKLYSKEAFDTNCTNTPNEEYISTFRVLCVDFANFLSSSKDNIPPKKGEKEFTDWYEKQISIIEFLQKGSFFTTDSFGNYSNKIELENFYNKIKQDSDYIDKVIKEKIEKDGLL